MRRELIEVGKTYSDGKAGRRKVVDIGPDGWGETCVRYALLAGKNNGKPLSHDDAGLPIFGCYVHSFQVWAKQIIELGPDAQK